MSSLHPHRRGFRRLGALLSLAFGLAFLAACGDEPLPSEPSPQQTPTHAVLEGRLLDPLGTVGLDSLRLALLELGAMRFEAQTLSNALGYFRIDQLPPGDYVPVIQGGDAVLLTAPRAGYVLSAGDTLRVELRALRLDPEEIQVSGVVVDAQSGAPISAALVEVGTTVGLPELFGYTTPNRQLSDLEGHFALSGILIFKPNPIDPGQVADLLVSAPGYRTLRRPLDELDLPALDLRLGLQAGQDDTRLTGRVVDLNGDALGGVALALEWVSRPESFFKQSDVPEPDQLVILGRTAVSDIDGRYSFEGLPGGRYHILPGYRVDDGWLRVDVSYLPAEFAHPLVTLPDSGQLEHGPIAAAPAIRPLSPAPGAVTSPQPDFRWEAWPFMGSRWATAYRLVIAPVGSSTTNNWLVLSPIPSNHFEWPSPDEMLPAGRYAWRVDGVVEGQVEGLPLFEGWAYFEVPGVESTLLTPFSTDLQILRSSTFLQVTTPAAGASGSLDGR